MAYFGFSPLDPKWGGYGPNNVGQPLMTVPADVLSNTVSLPPKPTGSASVPQAIVPFASPKQTSAPSQNFFGNLRAPSYSPVVYQNTTALANGLNQQMSGYYDAATGQMRDLFNEGKNVLRDQMFDPNWQNLMNMSMRRAARPGLDQATIDRMKGNLLATNAANQGTNMRQTLWGMAGRGVAGPVRDYMASMIRNASGAQAARGTSNIDIEAAKFAKGDEASAMSQAAGLLGQKGGIASMFANYLKSYNPLDQLQQIQQMQAPFKDIGYGQGRQGQGLNLATVPQPGTVQQSGNVGNYTPAWAVNYGTSSSGQNRTPEEIRRLRGNTYSGGAIYPFGTKVQMNFAA